MAVHHIVLKMGRPCIEGKTDRRGSGGEVIFVVLTTVDAQGNPTDSRKWPAHGPWPLPQPACLSGLIIC